MKITSIKQQVKKTDRYSVYVDEQYAFSLSETALLASQLTRGQELNSKELGELKRKSGDDLLYIRALNYVSRYSKTEWEVKFYLERKNASPVLIDNILNKLRDIGLVDDIKFATSYISNKRNLRPASRRKIMSELLKKRINKQIIEEALGTEREPEQAALLSMIESKRRQTKYQDDLKLMQYLARQGFNYEDIKSALLKDID